MPDEVIALMGAISLLLPFAAFGAWWLFHDYLRPRMMAKRGYIKIYRFDVTGRMKTSMIKPEFQAGADGVSGYVFKGKDGARYAFLDTSDLVFFENGVKATIYDSEGNQVSVPTMQKVVPAVMPQIIDSLMTRMWNVARASVGREKKSATLLILVAAIMAAGACLIGWQNLQAIAEIKALLPVAGG